MATDATDEELAKMEKTFREVLENCSMETRLTLVEEMAAKHERQGQPKAAELFRRLKREFVAE